MKFFSDLNTFKIFILNIQNINFKILIISCILSIHILCTYVHLYQVRHMLLDGSFKSIIIYLLSPLGKSSNSYLQDNLLGPCFLILVDNYDLFYCPVFSLKKLHILSSSSPESPVFILSSGKLVHLKPIQSLKLNFYCYHSCIFYFLIISHFSLQSYFILLLYFIYIYIYNCPHYSEYVQT